MHTAHAIIRAMQIQIDTQRVREIPHWTQHAVSETHRVAVVRALRAAKVFPLWVSTFCLFYCEREQKVVARDTAYNYLEKWPCPPHAQQKMLEWVAYELSDSMSPFD